MAKKRNKTTNNETVAITKATPSPMFDKKSNVVICPVGKNSTHVTWLNPENRNYDVYLIHFDKPCPDGVKLVNGIYYDQNTKTFNIYQKGYKFILIKALFDKKIINVSDYERFIFIDDDVVSSVDKMNKLFRYAEKNKWDFFHPAIAKLNYWHEILFSQPNVAFRRINWTETMSVGMNADTVKKVLKTFDENKTGYGLPNLWHQMFDYTDGTFVVVDDVEIIHSRGLASPDSYYKTLSDGNTGGLKDAMDEFHALLKKYKIRKVDHFEQKIYKQSPVTVATIYEMNDIQYLDEQRSSIPSFCNTVYLETRPIPAGSGFQHGDIMDETISDDGRHISAVLYYELQFGVVRDFSLFRNKAKELCKTDYIIYLDADERLIIHQQESLLKAIDSLYKDDKIGGVYFNIISNYMDANEPEWTCKVNKMVRLIRNVPEFKWIGKCHETIELSIDNAKFKMIPSTFKIDHIGYEFKRERLIEKMQRNVLTMLSDTETIMTLPFYRDILVRDINNLLRLTDGKITWQH